MRLPVGVVEIKFLRVCCCEMFTASTRTDTAYLFAPLASEIIFLRWLFGAGGSYC